MSENVIEEPSILLTSENLSAIYSQELVDDFLLRLLKKMRTFPAETVLDKSVTLLNDGYDHVVFGGVLLRLPTPVEMAAINKGLLPHKWAVQEVLRVAHTFKVCLVELP